MTTTLFPDSPPWAEWNHVGWTNRLAPAYDPARPVAGRGWMGHQFACGGWSAVTDARFLLAVRDGGLTGRASDVLRHATPPAKALGVVAELLDAPPADDAVDAGLSDLWGWLGAYHRHRCEVCHEDGPYGMDPDDCDDCGGRRWFRGGEANRLAVAAGAAVDADLLVWALDAALAGCGDAVRLWSRPAPPKEDARERTRAAGPADPRCDRQLFAEATGGEWRCVVMGVGTVGHEDAHPPAVYLPGAAPIWCRRHDAAGVVADWYEDRGETGFAADLRSRNGWPW